MTPSTFEGGFSVRFPANFKGVAARLSVTSYGNLINSFSGELLPSEAEFKPA